MQKMPNPNDVVPEPEPPEGIVFASVLRDLCSNWEEEAERVGAMASQQRSKELEHVGKTIGRAASQLRGLLHLAVPCEIGGDGEVVPDGWPVPLAAE